MACLGSCDFIAMRHRFAADNGRATRAVVLSVVVNSLFLWSNIRIIRLLKLLSAIVRPIARFVILLSRRTPIQFFASGSRGNRVRGIEERRGPASLKQFTRLVCKSCLLSRFAMSPAKARGSSLTDLGPRGTFCFVLDTRPVRVQQAAVLLR